MASEKDGYWPAIGARRCDSCKSAPALLFCRADAAYLCGECDARLHGARPRHERVWVCEVCEQAPASVTCKADAAALCAACDADIHSANPLALRHERALVVPFLEPLASAALLRLLPNLCANGLMKKPDGKPVDHFFSDVETYLDLEYATSMDARSQQGDGVVPVHAKAAVGDGGAPPPGVLELDLVGPKPCYIPYTADSLSHTVSFSEFGVVPDGNGGGAKGATVDVAGGGGGRAVDRKARVMRYREKRKCRRFGKTIRYASRKAYAETRPRIKGRFVKRSEIEAAEVGRKHSSAMRVAFTLDPGYGVVPSF
ncbi:Zinc finger protein CONSTANS-LIKE [Musa troglodytarum]|uniref:Zinc finger protein CONSTANS-LIKE n=1 Tax=Musa troglodytarum TaxID=320322 RepID=A0A9E7FAY6_9LILI|nr:Zinc finger protein CONSTANS-LIKE [Musa troglodytarum]